MLFICLLTGMQTIKAQTAEETLEWLNVKKVDIERNNGSVYSADKLRAADHYSSIAHDIQWQNIKEVIIKKGYGIVVKGKVIERCFKGCDWDDKSAESLTIYCWDSSPPEMIEKFVKALKHMAELKGAKFLNDNLF